ncbi:MAG: GNAT family N-acetyltransferase [Chloroflexales bacterium]|nr:GNAT family N-acetyltransferase [Chloroflexales bacterium]
MTASALAATLFRSRRGRPVQIRRADPEDAEALARMLGGLSVETVTRRYLMPCTMPAERARREAERLARHDDGQIVLVAQADGAAALIVAVAELVRDRGEQGVAESAIVVADAYQGEGIGRQVAACLASEAVGAAIRRVRATLFATNTPVRRLIRSLGRPYTTRHWRGEIQVEFSA